MGRRAFLCAIIACLALSACNPIEKLVNSKFPPVTADEHRKTAIASVTAVMAVMENPTVGANIRLSDAAATLNASDLRSQFGITDVLLRGEEQILFADVSVDKRLSQEDFPGLDDSTAQTIGLLKPQVRGKLSFGFGLTSAAAIESNGKTEIRFRLLPLFRNIHVDEVVLADTADVTAASDVIARILNRFADNVSGALSQSDFTKLTIPVVPNRIGETNSTVAMTNEDGISAKVTMSANPVASPVYLRSAAFLIDVDTVSILVDLAKTGTPLASATDTPAGEFADVKEQFITKMNVGFDVGEPNTTNWIGVSKALVAHIVNSAVEQGQPCFNVMASLEEQTFSQKIEIPDETTINCTPAMSCTPTRDCTPTRSCTPTENCEQTTDCRQTAECNQTRICRRCLFGICGNDPVCEAEKVLARGKCETAKEGRRLDCERLKSSNKASCEVAKEGRRMDCERLKTTEKAACESEKAAERIGCETTKTAKKMACESGKEALKRVARLGNLANLDGGVSGEGRLEICMRQIQISPTLENIDASLKVKGFGSADLHIKYVPLDIAGHLVCVADWSESKHVAVALPQQDLNVSSRLVLDTGENATLRANIQTSALAVQMRPGPTELIHNNYNMRLACPITGWLVDPVTLELSKAIPELRGDLTLPGQERTLTFQLGRTEMEIQNSVVSGNIRYSVTNKAIVLSGTLAPDIN